MVPTAPIRTFGKCTGSRGSINKNRVDAIFLLWRPRDLKCSASCVRFRFSVRLRGDNLREWPARNQLAPGRSSTEEKDERCFRRHRECTVLYGKRNRRWHCANRRHALSYAGREQSR